LLTNRHHWHFFSKMDTERTESKSGTVAYLDGVHTVTVGISIILLCVTNIERETEREREREKYTRTEI